ncbi:MAG TPA: hypothetical protein VHP83_12840, partial [Aggregatilineaceae bacterium]|nr:hypothetical protein [Aggregatilineaceae bacterium]
MKRLLFLLIVSLFSLPGLQGAGAQTTSEPNWTRSLAWSPDGAKIAVGTESGSLHILDQQGNVISTFQASGVPIIDMAWSPDGNRLITGGDDGIKLWDVSTGSLISDQFSGHRNWISSIRWSPDGSRIASAAFDSYPYGVIVWDANTGTQDFSIPNGYTLSVAWNSNGSVLAVGASGIIQLWDAFAGTLIKEIATAEEYEMSLDWSPDDSLIVGAEVLLGNPTLRIWDVQSGALVRQMVGHTDVV